MANKKSGKGAASKAASSKQASSKRASKGSSTSTRKKASKKSTKKKGKQTANKAQAADSGYPTGESPSIRRVMMPRDTNAVGTIFGGTILAEIDLAAATEAHKHHSGMVVTVSMDKIDFVAPVYVGDLVSFFTKTVRVGRSSICVQVSVWAQRRFGGGLQAHVTEAQVTMVAVDTNFRPIPVGTMPS